MSLKVYSGDEIFESVSDYYKGLLQDNIKVKDLSKAKFVLLSELKSYIKKKKGVDE